MELQPLGSRLDPTGPVYLFGNTYVRHIQPSEASVVKEMFASGFIAELVEHGLCPEFVEGEMDAQFPDYIAGMQVVKSTALKPAVECREFSFEMVKEAALAYLEIVLIADRYGFTLRDAHVGNFVFTGMRPVWVDLGSFCKKREQVPHPWIQEFFICFLLPLSIWTTQPMVAGHLANSSLRPAFKECVRLFLSSCRDNTVFARMRANLFCLNFTIDNYKGTKRLHRAAKAVLGKDTVKRVESLRKKISLLRYRGSTQWKSYHDGFLVDGEFPARLTDRFERIFSLVKETEPRSVLDLAGNAGVFSETIARRLPHLPVVCADYDACAIDALFCRQKKQSSPPPPNLTFAVLDCMRSASDAVARFRSDCVLALAVTHHLALSQKYTFERIFETIGKYSSRHVFIEFMPLGLYNGESAPEMPEWYTETQFRKSFEKFFTLDRVEVLEKNRILFSGRIIS